MKMRRRLALFLALAMLACLLTGCNKGTAGDNYAPGGNQGGSELEKPADGELSAPDKVGQTAVPPSQKLIRTIRVEAETEDMDDLLPQLEARVAELGGYIENKEVYNGSAGAKTNRYANLTIRIPAQSLDAFVTQVEGASNVVSTTESAEDVTLNYIATQSRLTALQTEEARLLELLAEAKDLNDLLTIESRLTEVRTELEEVTSQLRLYDNLVDYGTIKLNLREVKTYTVVEEEDPTLWQRLTRGFADNLRNLGVMLTDLLVFAVSASPYLLPFLVVLLIFLAVLALRRRARRRKSSQAEPPEGKSP